MSQLGLPTFVGNDFVIPQPRVEIATPEPMVVPLVITPPVAETLSIAPITTPVTQTIPSVSMWQKTIDGLHNHSVIAFSLLILMVASTGISVFGNYKATAIETAAKPLTVNKTPAPAIAGLNMSVPTAQLDARLKNVLNQSATLTVGNTVSPISPDTIRSWLQITRSANKVETGIHISAATIAKSVTAAAQKYEKTPVNQVTATYADGTSAVIFPGKNGSKLTEPDTIKVQAAAIAKTLFDAKGMAFTTPLEMVPFQSITPAAYSKLIEVNVITKQMYLYDNGQLTHTYPISAGAPATPTPIGQYKIFSKLPVQDMKGSNPNGTKYLQPHVHWINYFLPGGYAVHGNYWRPTSWFGNINSSHGCVSLPDDQAKEVYDWAPLGTTVITHY